MFDITRTLMLIKGAIFDPETTWAGYLPDAADWKKTALLLTGPLVLGSQVLSYVLDLIFPNQMPFAPEPSFVGMLISIVVAAIAAVVIALVVAVLAGLFKGKNSFPLALAATSLAFVPGYVGNALIHVPWIGWLLALALGIYGLVLLWRIVPKYLEVPSASRVGHYILSLVVSVVVMIILAVVVGGNMMASRSPGFDFSKIDKSGDNASTGMFSGLERQGKIMDAAANDTYDPPGTGKLSKSQVRNLVKVLTKTRDYRTSQAERLQELSEKAEQNEIVSVTEAISGMAGVTNITNAEMEVVKTGGGNWAEHVWVKEQLRIASIQKDINAAVEHNYELYLEFEDDLRELGL